MEQIYVTLVNRSSRDLVGRYDGKEHKIPANSRTQWLQHLAWKFKEQHPIMGSENFYSMDKQYLLGIEEFGDPVDPIEQSDKTTLINFDTVVLPSNVKIETLPGRPGNPRTDFGPKPLATDVVGFESNPVSGKPDVVTIDEAPIFEKP